MAPIVPAMLVAISPFVCCTAIADERGTAAIALRAGVYLEDHYIEVLKRTHSPMTAGREDMERQIIQEIVVQANKDPDGHDAFVFDFIMNWHEGDQFYLYQTGKLCRNPTCPDPAQDSMKAVFEFMDPEHFKLAVSYSEAMPVANSYSYVGDADRWINTATLVGRYQDETGHLYVFDADGSAILDNISTSYNIINEPVFVTSDFVQFDGLGRIPGSRLSVVPFRRVGNTLTWFDFDPSGGPDVGAPNYERPILKLNRLTE